MLSSFGGKYLSLTSSLHYPLILIYQYYFYVVFFLHEGVCPFVVSYVTLFSGNGNCDENIQIQIISWKSVKIFTTYQKIYTHYW